MKRMTVLGALNRGLHKLMTDHEEVLFLGEDILDPYGGAFKVARGLSDAFPDRVRTTPISEAGFTGVGIGLALKGFRPIIEIMFGDFSTLVVDQLINHATKMTWMYDQHLDLPLVVRTPMGGRRGYGPTHSQSLERLFLGVPGLTTLAISPITDPGDLLAQAVLGREPVFFVEHKLLYAEPLADVDTLNKQGWIFAEQVGEGMYPTSRLRHSHPPHITLVVTGGMVPLALEAAAFLHDQEELDLEILVPHCLSPLDVAPIIQSVRHTRRLVVVEEGQQRWGWGSEVVAAAAAVALDAPPQRVGAKPFPIPAARTMEDQVLPGVRDIVEAVIATVDDSFH